MQRYHDVISSFGGKTSYDADNRPLLVMRSNLWSSGYDVDGTDQASLGQFSGRVQQTYKHSVPRFFVPEHGTMFTLALVRFPPTATKGILFFSSRRRHTNSLCDWSSDVCSSDLTWWARRDPRCATPLIDSPPPRSSPTLPPPLAQSSTRLRIPRHLESASARRPQPRSFD